MHTRHVYDSQPFGTFELIKLVAYEQDTELATKRLLLCIDYAFTVFLPALLDTHDMHFPAMRFRELPEISNLPSLDAVNALLRTCYTPKIVPSIAQHAFNALSTKQRNNSVRTVRRHLERAINSVILLLKITEKALAQFPEEKTRLIQSYNDLLVELKEMQGIGSLID